MQGRLTRVEKANHIPTTYPCMMHLTKEARISLRFGRLVETEPIPSMELESLKQDIQEEGKIEEEVKTNEMIVEKGQAEEIEVEAEDEHRNEGQEKEWEFECLQGHGYVDPFDYLIPCLSMCPIQN